MSEDVSKKDTPNNASNNDILGFAFGYEKNGKAAVGRQSETVIVDCAQSPSMAYGAPPPPADILVSSSPAVPQVLEDAPAMTMPILAPGMASDPNLPSRPGKMPCQFFLKTRTCKFGTACVWDHPMDASPSSAGPALERSQGYAGLGESASADFGATSSQGLPLRPGAATCTFYAKTGNCNFGAACKWDHPEGQGGLGGSSQPLTMENTGLGGLGGLGGEVNNQGLPRRPHAPPCAFYLKTGVCKFGASCKHDHPDQ